MVANDHDIWWLKIIMMQLILNQSILILNGTFSIKQPILKKYEHIIYSKCIIYILDPFGSRMGSSIFVFKKHYQMEMKLKNKTMPTFKITFISIL